MRSSMPEPALSLRELRLQTADPDSLLRFYRDTLGLPTTRRSEGAMSFDAGSTRIAFRRATDGRRPYYHLAFTIPENKLVAAIRWARRRVELIPGPGDADPVVRFRSINADSIYFRDPAGNLLELIARHDLDNPADGPFGPGDVLSASEIGLVVDDVPRFVADVTRTFGLTVYPATREPSDRFSMVGSATGTLIVVRRGRVWFMTDELEGAVFPTEVVVDAPLQAELEPAELPYRIVARGCEAGAQSRSSS